MTHPTNSTGRAWALACALPLILIACDSDKELAANADTPPAAANAPVAAPTVDAAPGATPTAKPKLPPTADASPLIHGDVDESEEADAPDDEDGAANAPIPVVSRKSKRASAKRAGPRRDRSKTSSDDSSEGMHGSEPGDGTSPFEISRFVVARDIQGREPVGASSTFEADTTDRVYAFVEVQNPELEEGDLTVRFDSPKGRRIRIKLHVGAQPRWRTWAFTRKATETGTWRVSVLDEAKTVLTSSSFTILSSDPNEDAPSTESPSTESPAVEATAETDTTD